jgi:HAD superfamily hydrolase (TIGR01509 family)
MNNRIKAVIFDMDGVLIDAKEWHYEALNQALELFGYSISRYDHLVTFDGLPTKRKLEMLSMERGLPVGLHEFINKMKQTYTMERVYIQCKPRFIHQYALSKLRAEEYRLAVCSNSIKVTIEMMMDKADLTQYFEFMLSNQDVKKAKPDPEIYILAIDRLGLKAEECLIIEDNQNGIKAAIASGGHLFKVDSANEVTYSNIKNKIEQIEAGRK